MGIILAATLLMCGYFGYLGQKSKSMEPQIGITESILKSCPDKPNCVSTQANDQGHRIDPIGYQDDLAIVADKIEKVLLEMQANIQKREDQYFHATFSSNLFGFVDDFEVYIDDANKLIHIRSASRVGHSDLGANKKRYILFKENLNF